jgi:hypothetical protein
MQGAQIINDVDSFYTATGSIYHALSDITTTDIVLGQLGPFKDEIIRNRRLVCVKAFETADDPAGIRGETWGKIRSTHKQGGRGKAALFIVSPIRFFDPYRGGLCLQTRLPLWEFRGCGNGKRVTVFKENNGLSIVR